MFTGIIESLGTVSKLVKDQDNLHITIQSELTSELKIDQSIAHNGICLTVIGKEKNSYTVTAIKETLQKTNLASLKVNAQINLERAMKMDARLDGHIVQGHVDCVATCTAIKVAKGSWYFSFEYKPNKELITIEKGSITINGVSLTVVDSGINTFSVAIIPFTYNHTNFSTLKVGDLVNLEFDVIGKYVAKLALVANFFNAS